MVTPFKCTASIKVATTRDASFVGAHLRDGDKDECECQMPYEHIDWAAFGALLVSYPGFHFSAWLGDKLGTKPQPVAIFGFVQSELPWLWSAYAVGTDDMPRAIPAISRWCVGHCLPLLSNNGVKRVEVRVKSDYEASIRWLRRMSANYEGTLTNYGKNGEDFDLMVWTDENLPTNVFSGSGKIQPAEIIPAPNVLEVGTNHVPSQAS